MAELERLAERLSHTPPTLPQCKTDGVITRFKKDLDVRKLRNEHNAYAQDLQERLLKLHTILSHERLGGKINLGTDPKKINWKSMPAGVAAIFRPEFGFQAEEITGFHINTKDYSGSNGEVNLQLTLDRHESWWSYVNLGVIVRSDYVRGFLYPSCLAESGQLIQSRSAMKALEKLVEPARRTGDDRADGYIESINTMRLTEGMLDFSIAVLEKQLDAPRGEGK